MRLVIALAAARCTAVVVAPAGHAGSSRLRLRLRLPAARTPHLAPAVHAVVAAMLVGERGAIGVVVAFARLRRRDTRFAAASRSSGGTAAAVIPVAAREASYASPRAAVALAADPRVGVLFFAEEASAHYSTHALSFLSSNLTCIAHRGVHIGAIS